MGEIVRFRQHRRTARPTPARRRGWFALVLIGAPLAAFVAVLLLPLGPEPETAMGAGYAALPRPALRAAAELDAQQPDTAALAPARAGPAALASGGRDAERAAFALCAGGRRVTCVVDGDTIWYKGEKIRLADLDAPEVFSPACPREAEMGRRATARLQALLAAGPFSLEPNPEGAARDRYGRSLMLVTRGGESLGAALVREGLAEQWGGPRVDWC